MKVLHLGLFFGISLMLGTIGVSQEEEVQRSFRVLGYGNSHFEGIFLEVGDGRSAEEQIALEFLPNRKSVPIDLGGRYDRLAFFADSTNARGKSVKAEIGRIDWPEDAEKLLLVFLERESSDGLAPSFEILVMDESKAVWGQRCVRFLNLTGVGLDVRMKDFAFPLGEGLTDIIRFEGEHSVPMTLELSLPWRGKREVVYSARFVADQHSPKLLVVKPPLVEGSMRVAIDTIW